MACCLRIRNYIIAKVQFTILSDISNFTLSNAATVALKALDFVSGIDASYVHPQRVPMVSQAIANLAGILDQAGNTRIFDRRTDKRENCEVDQLRIYFFKTADLSTSWS